MSPDDATAQPGPGLISGRLQHAPAQPVDISFADAVFPFRQTLTTDTAGRFAITLLLHDTTEICLQYNGIPVFFFALPNDSVYLDLDAELFEPSGKFLQNATVGGRLAAANRTMFGHIAAFNAVARETTPPNYADPNQSPFQYQDMRLDELLQSLRSWQEYQFDFEDFDPLFQRWSDARLRYQAGVDIMQFPMVPGVRHQLNDTSAYFDFEDIVPLNNHRAHFFSSWHNYLHAYTKLLENLAQYSPFYKSRRNNLREFGYPAPMARNQLVLEMLLSLSPGEGRQAMLSAFFANELTGQGTLTQFQVRAFTQTIPYRQRVPIQVRMQQGKVDWTQRIDNWTGKEDLRKELRTVTDALAGKATQLCFVTDLCPECQHTPAPITGYEQMLVSVYGVPGHGGTPSPNIRLSDEASAFWMVYSGVQHFPACILLDKEGEIVR